METDLTGQVLIAMPAMGDARFARAVLYICAHSTEGAMGLVVNRPLPELRFAELLEQLDITATPDMRELRILIGGPVEESRGFVLHSLDYRVEESTLEIASGVGLTSTLEVLDALARGVGPREATLALGYAGWGPGQLEGELAQNAWLTAPASRDLLFGRAYEHKWTAALRSLGVDPRMLSSDAGTA